MRISKCVQRPPMKVVSGADVPITHRWRPLDLSDDGLHMEDDNISTTASSLPAKHSSQPGSLRSKEFSGWRMSRPLSLFLLAVPHPCGLTKPTAAFWPDTEPGRLE